MTIKTTDQMTEAECETLFAKVEKSGAEVCEKYGVSLEDVHMVSLLLIAGGFKGHRKLAEILRATADSVEITRALIETGGKVQ